MTMVGIVFSGLAGRLTDLAVFFLAGCLVCLIGLLALFRRPRPPLPPLPPAPIWTYKTEELPRDIRAARGRHPTHIAERGDQ